MSSPSTSGTSSSKIPLFYNNGSALVWDAADALKLRQEYRMLGKLLGPYPGEFYQVNKSGLPLCLRNEEAKLLLEIGKGVLVEPSFEVQESQVKLYKEHVNKVARECQLLTKSQKEEKLKLNIEKIIEKRKLRSCKGVEKIETIDLIKEKLETHDMMNKNSFPLQLFTKHPWVYKTVELHNEWAYPSGKKEELKYSVYRDLWNKGYYISCGLQFGCDYLVYECDPLAAHARYMVICKDKDEDISALHFVSLSRLAVQVNKQLIIASVSVEHSLSSSPSNSFSPIYMAFTWRGNQDSPFKRTLIKL